MPISFLILTYNSSSYIYPLLDSLSEKIDSKLKKGDFEIVIVDNDSSDDTIQKISKYLSEKKEWEGHVQFEKSKENLGYASGINLAAKKANGEILVIINPDSQLLESDFEALIDRFQTDNKLGVVGLRLVDSKGQDEKTAGKFYNAVTFFLFAIGLENIFSLRFAPKKTTTVDYVSGGFVAIRGEVFKQLNGYDADYFMYVEDMDLCFRAKELGFKTIYMPCAVIRHQGQGSSNREFAIVNIYKGIQIFNSKHSSFFMQQYVKNLLSLKAALIIFIASAFGRRTLVETYQKALKNIS